MEVLSSQPRLFLTSMSGPGQIENMTEMIEPILDHIDGIIWVLNDCPKDDPGARYLETVKGAGEIIYREKTPRKFHSLNEILCSRMANEGDFLIFCEPNERPAIPFLKRVQSEIGPMMLESETSAIFYKMVPYLIRLDARQQFVQSLPEPESYALMCGRAIDWANIQPDEREVKTRAKPTVK